MRTLLSIFLTAGVALAQRGAPTGPPQGPPPKNLTKLADGHLSANADPANAGDFEVHTVVAGETLSGIAAVSMKDMKLWPQLWEQNEHVVNPHWIYPNDKILVRRVTKIAEATPPPPPEAAPPAPAPIPAAPEPPRPPTRLAVAPYPAPPAAVPLATISAGASRNFPEVKESDLYCSGFIRLSVLDDMKVLTLSNSDAALMATEGNYVYINKGTKDGVQVGYNFQIVRPTRSVDSPSRETTNRKLGTHYLEIAHVQVVLGRDNASLARVTQSCEPIEVGDLVLPYTRGQFPTLPSRRPFSAMMKASGQLPGKIVMSKSVLLNFGSELKGTTRFAGVGESFGHLGALDRGIAGENKVVYIDIGKSSAVKPGDLFIVYRDMDASGILVREGETPEKRRIAVGEIVILRVEDRASTALVTYSTDGISLGDSVERR